MEERKGAKAGWGLIKKTMEDTVESPLGNVPIPPTMGGGKDLRMVGLSMSCLHGLTKTRR